MRREPLATIRTSLHGCSVWSSDEGKKLSEYKYQLVLYFRRMCSRYLYWTEMSEHLFIFCRLNEMEEIRKPAKRARHSEDQEGTCIRISATSYLKLNFHYLYFSYLTRVFFFVMFNARSIDFDSVGKRQRSS